MTEAHIGFLYKAASVFIKSEHNETHNKLKSYYLMKCKDITRGYGLPKKHFSETTRCSFCCLEWNTNCEVKLNSIKLSKQQRKRIKYKSKHKANNKESLLYSNEIEKTCSFCGKSVKTPLIKPNKLKPLEAKPDVLVTMDVSQSKKKKVKTKPDKRYQSNVYCKSRNAFALNKQNNSLPSTIKVKPKIIKNNKKKKDKFAGLCQQAVIAATKFKQEKTKDNKLNLFLKQTS